MPSSSGPHNWLWPFPPTEQCWTFDGENEDQHPERARPQVTWEAHESPGQSACRPQPRLDSGEGKQLLLRDPALPGICVWLRSAACVVNTPSADVISPGGSTVCRAPGCHLVPFKCDVREREAANSARNFISGFPRGRQLSRGETAQSRTCLSV